MFLLPLFPKTCGEYPLRTVLCLAYSATCRIANLTLRALHGACIAHRQGQARVESCVLYVSAKRVATHCLAPIVTYACTSLGQQVLMASQFIVPTSLARVDLLCIAMIAVHPLGNQNCGC